jgi:hypothetical protein
LLLTNPFFATPQCAFPQFFNQGWYDNVIAVDPTDPNRVWAGGIDFFRSDDGGQNWGLASLWWVNTSNTRYNHADKHVIAFSPEYNGTTNTTIFTGSDGGVIRTNNALAATANATNAACNSNNSTAISWTQLNNSYGITQFYFGLPYPNGTTYFGGTQDNGTVRGTDASGINAWTTVSGGDGGYVAIDSGNSNIIFTEFTGLSLQKSTNGGTNFSSATSGITENSNNFLFITPFIMDPSSARRLWIGGQSLWRTTNQATNWTQASDSTGVDGSVSAIAVAPSNANLVLAGKSSNGSIYRTNIGLTSTSATIWSFATPRSGYVSWLAYDPVDPTVAYATYSTFGGTHVWKTVDGGATWTGIDGSGSTGIPDIPVHTIVVDPANRSRLYVGTDLGVFTSQDGGASWAVENTGFVNVVTEALILQNNTLFAFTHGRGAWKVALNQNVVAAPVITNVSPSSGQVGSQVTLTGSGLLSTTKVWFVGNVAAAFTVNSDNQLTVTVPSGAKTGKILVVNPAGRTTSRSKFTILP